MIIKTQRVMIAFGVNAQRVRLLKNKILVKGANSFSKNLSEIRPTRSIVIVKIPGTCELKIWCSSFNGFIPRKVFMARLHVFESLPFCLFQPVLKDAIQGVASSSSFHQDRGVMTYMDVS